MVPENSLQMAFQSVCKASLSISKYYVIYPLCFSVTERSAKDKTTITGDVGKIYYVNKCYVFLKRLNFSWFYQHVVKFSSATLCCYC